MVEGQIFGLLGHNGAGKSTLISILSGSLAPSSGSATIYGLDIATDMPAVRSQLGLCPQHNLLVDFLTVREHLDLYLKIKGGIPVTQFRDAIAEMLEVFELTEIASQVATTLSGGQKTQVVGCNRAYRLAQGHHLRRTHCWDGRSRSAQVVGRPP